MDTNRPQYRVDCQQTGERVLSKHGIVDEKHKITIVDGLKILDTILSIAKSRQTSVLDACMIYCAENDVDAESFARFVKKTPTLYDLIHTEASALRLLSVK